MGYARRLAAAKGAVVQAGGRDSGFSGVACGGGAPKGTGMKVSGVIAVAAGGGAMGIACVQSGKPRKSLLVGGVIGLLVLIAGALVAALSAIPFRLWTASRMREGVKLATAAID